MKTSSISIFTWFKLNRYNVKSNGLHQNLTKIKLTILAYVSLHFYLKKFFGAASHRLQKRKKRYIFEMNTFIWMIVQCIDATCDIYSLDLTVDWNSLAIKIRESDIEVEAINYIKKKLEFEYILFYRYRWFIYELYKFGHRKRPNKPISVSTIQKQNQKNQRKRIEIAMVCSMFTFNYHWTAAFWIFLFILCVT